MPTTPWRIATQSLVVLDPDTKEPAFTLSFEVNHAQADQVKLRMTPVEGLRDVLEFTFSTGGYLQGEPVRIAARKEKPAIDSGGNQAQAASAG